MLSNRWSLLLIFHIIFVFDLKFNSASGLLNLPFTTHQTKTEDGSSSTVLKVPFGLGTIGLEVNYDKKADNSANQNNIQPTNTIQNHEDCVSASTESALQESQSNNGNSKSSGFLLIPQIPNGFNFKVHLGPPGLPPPPHRGTYNCQHHYPGSEPYPRPTFDYYLQQSYPPLYYPPPQQPSYPTQEPKPSYYPTQEPKPQYPPYYPTQEPSAQPPTYYPAPESKPQQPTYYPTQEVKPQQPTYYPSQEYYPAQQPNQQPSSYYPSQESKPQPQPTYPTYPTYPTNPPNPTYPQKLDPWQPGPEESPSASVPGDSSSSSEVTETPPETPSETPSAVPAISIAPTPDSGVDSSGGTVGNQIPGSENENTNIAPWGPENGDSNDANSSNNKDKKEETGEGTLDIRIVPSPGRKPSRNKIHS